MEAVESFVSKSNISPFDSAHPRRLTVISNGSYRHLNNHLAPTHHHLTLSISSLLRVALFLSSRNLGAISDARFDDRRKTAVLSLAFHFFTVTDD